MTATKRHRVPRDLRAVLKHLSWPTAAAEIVRGDDGVARGLIVPVAHPEWHRLARILGAATPEEIDRIEQARWFVRDEYHASHHAKGKLARNGYDADLVWACYCRWVCDQCEIAEAEAMTLPQLIKALVALGFTRRGRRILGLIEKVEHHDRRAP